MYGDTFKVIEISIRQNIKEGKRAKAHTIIQSIRMLTRNQVIEYFLFSKKLEMLKN